MKRSRYAMLALTVLAVLCVSPALAEKTPDAGVKGLWLKAMNLPKEAYLEDMTQDEGEPYFIYSFGDGPDGPLVTMPVGRYPQNAQRREQFLKLDKKALAEFVGSDNFAETAKDLTFTAAPKFSEKFSYPCQMATYTDSEMGLRFIYLFIQTDQYMFSVNVVRDMSNKDYSDADAEKWLTGLKMVEQ